MALRPNTGIPFDATYDPIAAYDYEERGGGIVAPAPMESGEALMMTAAPSVANVGVNEANRTMIVNGKEFSLDDHQSAIESEALLGPDKESIPIPQGYREVTQDEYHNYLNQIDNPTVGRLMKKNVGIGVDVSQQLAGSALKFFGAEETGQAIIDQQTEDLRFNQPYQRAATDIESAGDAGMWFVANAAQMAPLMAEMIITSALTGGAAGFAAGATATGARLLARGGARKAGILQAARADRGLKTLQAGKKLDRKSEEYLALRRAGRIFGAKTGAIAAAEGVAIGDIYQAVEESGNYDSPALARLMTLLMSVPYAAAEVLPAFAAVRFARGGGSALKRGNLPWRATKGAVAGFGIEGTTEAFQDMLSLGTSGKLDFTDPEVVKQLINAFAAGAGVGVGIGGVAGAISKRVDVEKENVDLTGAEDAVAEKEEVDFSDRFPDPDAGIADDGAGVPSAALVRNQELPLEGPQGPAQGELDLSEQFDSPQDEAALYNNEMEAFSTDPNQMEMDLQDPSPGPLFDYVAPEPTPDTAMARAYTEAEQSAATPPPAAPPVPPAPPLTPITPQDVADFQGFDPVEADYNLALTQQAEQQAAQAPAIVDQQFEQSRQPPPGQLELPMDTSEFQVGPTDMWEYANLPLGTSEPSIMVPRRNPQTGQMEMAPVDVRVVLEENQQRTDALKEHRTCLRGLK